MKFIDLSNISYWERPEPNEGVILVLNPDDFDFCAKPPSNLTLLSDNNVLPKPNITFWFVT